MVPWSRRTASCLRFRAASPHGIFGPVITPAGMAAFGRDPASARQVWSRQGGYPGDPRYREFHSGSGGRRAVGLPRALRGWYRARVSHGLKYHRVTGGSGPKELYDPEAAGVAVEEHADHFVGERARQLGVAARSMERPPMVLAPYDAELFGHWWYEGPQFIDAVVRRLATPGSGMGAIGLGGYLARYAANPVSQPATSTWGEEGHLGVWLDASNAWMQRPLRWMAGRMSALARLEPLARGVRLRALSQLARELMLAQSSDWPFLIRMGTAKEYARTWLERHEAAFRKLEGDDRRSEPWDDAALAEMETRDNLFPEIDPQWWV